MSALDLIADNLGRTLWKHSRKLIEVLANVGREQFVSC